MSASASAAKTGSLARTISLGIVKMQIFDVTHVSGDTTCAITADTMTTLQAGLLCGGSVVQTSAPTYSGNTVTFTFTDPAATRYSQCIVFGV